MIGFNFKSVYTVAKKEFLDNIRNKWIIVLTILFIILPLLFSYALSSTDEIFGNMENTVLALVAISSLFIPLIAIIIGFSTISGEDESGALSIVLSYPIRRVEVLFGKLFGLGSVIILSIFLGFGISGIIITLSGSDASWGPFTSFILYSIGLGFVFLSCSIFISALCKSRIRSIGGAILLFFFGPIAGIILIAIAGGMGHDVFIGDIPSWIIDYQVLISPADLVQSSVSVAYGIKVFEWQGMIITIPEYMTHAYFASVQLIWIIVPLILAYFFFKRRDI
jgi:ABC-type transport system involved in multi-copper enzyme maturation permease subunit